ncbi:MAG: right-handed parallel beta-helix repeat-containing protein [Candidatus Kariarchaeaceae archaeon]
MSGTLIFQNTESNRGNINITRPVADTTGYEMEGSDFDSFDQWFPEKTLQDFMTKTMNRGQVQYDLASQGMPRSNEISTLQLADPVVVAFDATHEPLLTTVFQLQEDLSMFGVELIIIEGEFFIPDGVNVLLLSGSNFDYTPEEVDQIFNWFYSDGPHLLWVAGDSDYGGYFLPDSSNMILDSLGSELRIAADAVQDDINNDGAPYRVAIPSPACEGEYSCTFTEGVGSAIFHGPTTVLGYSDGNVVDLNDNPLAGVEVVMRASSDAYPLNQDLSTTDFDYYSNNGLFGDYPMMAIQDMGADKFVIASGEAIFSDYQNMYAMETANGVWNGGFHEGKVLVDNVLTWFGVNRELTFDDPIYIFGNDDFINYGFPGSGTPEDPFIIEGFSITNPNDNLINIFDTDAYFVLRDNVLDGQGSWVTGISLFNVKNGIMENNFISGTGQAINLDYSMNNAIISNYLDSNGGGVNLWESRDNTIDGNEITNNGWAGISLTNEQPMVWMRFNEDVTATERDSIAWEASFEDPDEGLVWYYHDTLEVSLTLDGEPVPVEIWEVYFDDWAGLWRFDMGYFTEPLPLGEHVFETHFFLEGEEIGSGMGHVTVLLNAVVPIRFFQDATITVGDQIAWQASVLDPDLAALEEYYLIFETVLTLNEVPVEVTYSDIYYEDESEQYRFDVDYLTDPLDIGEYLFDVHFFENGVEVYIDFDRLSVVTVLPLSVDDNNYISNNIIVSNGQGMWIDNSNSNFLFGNTIENNWGEAVGSWQSHRNVFTDNIIQNNNGWGLSIGGSDNFVSNNIVRWNQMGISVHEGSNNVVSFNEVYQNWGGPGIDIWANSDAFLTENDAYENGVGLSIADSPNTQVHSNRIHDNFDNGVDIVNSPLTSITDNAIFWNWGAGISSHRETNIPVHFLESKTVTDQDSIWWFAESSSDDPDYLQFEHDNIFVELSLDGEPIWVELGDIWFDDGEGVFRYEIFHQSPPLPVGLHVFQVHFFLEGFFDLQFETYVEVVPGEVTNDDYSITGNYIGRNGWTGLNLANINGAFIDDNRFGNNAGQSIAIMSSTNIVVTNNNILSEAADMGVALGDSSNSVVSNNEISGHWGPAIHLQNSSNNVVEGNEIYNNGAGISLDMSTDNIIQNNEIYWNWGDGVNFHNSHDNLVFDNDIYENGGAGIWSTAGSSDTDVFFNFGDDIVVSDQMNLHLGMESVSDDPDYLQYEHDNLVTELTINGEPAEVGYSEIWFDEGDGMFRYVIFYDSGPLPVGEYDFEIHFTLDGEELFSTIGHVTVIAVTTEPTPNNNDFNNNYVAYNGWVGIGLDRVVGGSVDSNTIEGNWDSGVFLQASTMVEVTNNVIQFNANGVLLVESSNNLISFNEIFDGFGAGVGVLFNSNGNVITHNVVHDLGDDGIGGWDSHGNVIMFNEIYNVDDGIIFRYSNDNTITNNYIHHNNNRGIFLTTEPWDPVQMRFYEDITVSDVESIFWQATSVYDDFDYLQYEHDNMVVELTVDGEPVWVDKSDIWFDEWDGLFKYDMNYFSGPLPVGEHFFVVRFMLEENIELEIPGFEFEFTAVVTVIPNETTSSGYVISNNVITDNANTAVRLFGSDANLISMNVIANNGFGGIAILNSNDNIIINNLSHDNVRSGIFLRSSSGNSISGNWVFNMGYAGITISRGSSENVVFFNTVSSNPTGISVEMSSWNAFLFNKVENNEYGFYLLDSHENSIIRNVVNGNFAGIVLEGSNDNEISNNHIMKNAYGLALLYSNNNLVKSNKFKKNGVAIYSEFSYDNSFSWNWLYKNETDWVIIE